MNYFQFTLDVWVSPLRGPQRVAHYTVVRKFCRLKGNIFDFNNFNSIFYKMGRVMRAMWSFLRMKWKSSWSAWHSANMREVFNAIGFPMLLAQSVLRSVRIIHNCWPDWRIPTRDEFPNVVAYISNQTLREQEELKSNNQTNDNREDWKKKSLGQSGSRPTPCFSI